MDLNLDELLTKRDELSKKVSETERQLSKEKKQLEEVTVNILKLCSHDWKLDFETPLEPYGRRNLICEHCDYRITVLGNELR